MREEGGGELGEPAERGRRGTHKLKMRVISCPTGEGVGMGGMEGGGY